MGPSTKSKEGWESGAGGQQLCWLGRWRWRHYCKCANIMQTGRSKTHIHRHPTTFLWVCFGEKAIPSFNSCLGLPTWEANYCLLSLSQNPVVVPLLPKAPSNIFCPGIFVYFTIGRKTIGGADTPTHTKTAEDWLWRTAMISLVPGLSPGIKQDGDRSLCSKPVLRNWSQVAS